MSATLTTPLPSALAVRELLEGMVGREVEAHTGTAAVNPGADPGAVVAVYVDDALALRSIVVVDLALAAHLGAAIALIPAATARTAVEDAFLPPALYENAAEILNVAASLFNLEGAPHVRLYQAYAPRETLPADIAQWTVSYVTRLDMAATVVGYGTGRLSVLVV